MQHQFFAFQVHVFGPEIIEYFSYGATPDEICYQIGLPLFFGKEKMAIILPTGQWYAPSAIINDAWYCMV